MPRQTKVECAAWSPNMLDLMATLDACHKRLQHFTKSLRFVMFIYE
jgi:hypothetical protein